MKKGYKKGFTAVELLVVIAVIAVLAALAMFSLTRAQRSARDTQVFQDMKTLQTALEFYYTENGHYPAVADGAVWSNPSETGLAKDLSPFLTQMPESPRADQHQAYSYLVNSAGDAYYLSTQLENSKHDALTNDVDGSVGGDSWSEITSLNEVHTNATVNCDDSTGLYCVSNK